MINELLRDKLKILASDDYFLTALEAVFSERIEQEKPQIKIGDDDKLIGEKYRAYIAAKDILGEAINDIRAYKEFKNNIKGLNKGI